MSSSAVVVMILLVFALAGIAVVGIIRSVDSARMNGMTTCKTCGNSIAKSAQFCPFCGAKRPRQASLSSVLLLVLFIVIVVKVANGTGSKTNNQSKPTVKSSTSQSNTNKQNTENQTYTIGDTLEHRNISATLKSVQISEGNDAWYPADGNVFIAFELDIANNSTDSLSVSSIACFDAYADNYALKYSLSSSINEGSNSLNGTIASGKMIRGTICFEAPEDWQTAEIRFKPSVWGSSEFIFTVDRSQVK